MNKMTFSGICNKVCNMAIANYHLLNHTDRPKENPFGKNTIEHFIYLKCWAHTAIWHLENHSPGTDADGKGETQIRQRLETSRKEQDEATKKARQAIVLLCKTKNPQAEACLAADRLIDTINRFADLLLQIYHASEQIINPNASMEQIGKCQQMLDEMIIQKTSLSILLDQQMGQICREPK